LDEAISLLRRYSLVQHDPEHKTLSIHRLVQTIRLLKNPQTKLIRE
jgi:hypothetical protein